MKPAEQHQAAAFDLERLRELDRLLYQNNYPEERLAAMVPYVAQYLALAPQLRALPLGEGRSAFNFLAGGKR